MNDLLASGEVGEQRRKMVATATPLGRLGRPDEIAKAVVFLASEDSSYITGIEPISQLDVAGSSPVSRSNFFNNLQASHQQAGSNLAPFT